MLSTLPKNLVTPEIRRRKVVKRFTRNQFNDCELDRKHAPRRGPSCGSDLPTLQTATRRFSFSACSLDTALCNVCILLRGQYVSHSDVLGDLFDPRFCMHLCVRGMNLRPQEHPVSSASLRHPIPSLASSFRTRVLEHPLQLRSIHCSTRPAQTLCSTGEACGAGVFLANVSNLQVFCLTIATFLRLCFRVSSSRKISPKGRSLKAYTFLGTRGTLRVRWNNTESRLEE